MYEGLQGLFTLKGFYFKQMFIEFVHVKEGGFSVPIRYLTTIDNPVSGGEIFREIPVQMMGS